ncbi:hypothetical protein M427DRAFT_72929 [Gonapodya prolifera JEL478]|uniref:Uncharacterized protein n=1 Tax=Gonapodya prolifera (strain JEL478) TaxID=1344416 RepID=A0A139A3V5_GONPJ|nr:hypothetical protein M427DRAFT_72929 [Gonapodya prolifera JEL478]|eukprot:KXS11470.1 hypothetical protein M427DRAFT_72929 [Gonapodya prolifera JEL478]
MPRRTHPRRDAPLARNNIEWVAEQLPPWISTSRATFAGQPASAHETRRKAAELATWFKQSHAAPQGTGEGFKGERSVTKADFTVKSLSEPTLPIKRVALHPPIPTHDSSSPTTSYTSSFPSHAAHLVTPFTARTGVKGYEDPRTVHVSFGGGEGEHGGEGKDEGTRWMSVTRGTFRGGAGASASSGAGRTTVPTAAGGLSSHDATSMSTHGAGTHTDRLTRPEFLSWPDLPTCPDERWRTVTGDVFVDPSEVRVNGRAGNFKEVKAGGEEGKDARDKAEVPLPWKQVQEADPGKIKTYDRSVHFLMGSTTSTTIPTSSYTSSYPSHVQTSSTPSPSPHSHTRHPPPPLHPPTTLLTDDPSLLHPSDRTTSTFRLSYPVHDVGGIWSEARGEAERWREFNKRTAVPGLGGEMERDVGAEGVAGGGGGWGRSVTKEDFGGRTGAGAGGGAGAGMVGAGATHAHPTPGARKSTVTFGTEPPSWRSETHARFPAPAPASHSDAPVAHDTHFLLADPPLDQTASHFTLGTSTSTGMSGEGLALESTTRTAMARAQNAVERERVLERRPAGVPSSNKVRQEGADAFKVSLGNTMPLDAGAAAGGSTATSQSGRAHAGPAWTPWATQSQLAYTSPGASTAHYRPTRPDDIEFSRTKRTVQREDGGVPGWTTSRAAYMRPEWMVDRSVYSGPGQRT